MRQYRVTTGPASEVVSLSEAKTYLKVETTADDDLITALIIAARELAENYTNRKLLPQTITERFDAFSTVIELSCAPLLSVTSIEYTDTDGATQTASTSLYLVQDYRDLPLISLKSSQSWPTTISQANAVEVVYQVGYADAASVPETFKNAIKRMVAYWYEKREESVRKMPTDVEWMLHPYRIVL